MTTTDLERLEVAFERFSTLSGQGTHADIDPEVIGALAREGLRLIARLRAAEAERDMAIRESIRLGELRVAAEAELALLRPYLRHLDNCEWGKREIPGTSECTCGLVAAFDRGVTTATEGEALQTASWDDTMKWVRKQDRKPHG